MVQQNRKQGEVLEDPQPVVPAQAGTLRTCAVIGAPVSHSLSPVVHRAGYRALGLADLWRYERHEVGGTRGPSLVEFLTHHAEAYCGLSVTMPLKEQAAAVATAKDPLVELTGVANTLVRQGCEWKASNTDVPGIVGAFARAGVSRICRGAVMGGGATARSAVAALASMGVADLTLITRRDLDSSLQDVLHQLGVQWRRLTWGEASDRGSLEVEAIVITVPGDISHPPIPHGASTRAVEVPATPVPLTAAPGAAILDVAYHGRPRWVEAEWAAAGLRWVPGWWMLAEQAFVQFTSFTGCAAPKDAMWAALESAMAQQAASGR